MGLLLCGGGDCPRRHRCERHTTEIFGRRDFFGEPPYDLVTGECEYFLEDFMVVQKVRERAYYLWLEEGRPEGRAFEHWQRAEQQLDQST
ncbi:MAG: DUF2934 domain-containing protein [Deltaproteobacteria bacterium]|nr:DUF2934 domain-containing protein [Deltaproteobacteria bacterium]